MKIIGNAVSFVILYLIFMCPTYILPYLGSNSAILGGAATALDGHVFTPATWIHLGSLLSLVVITWIRGSLSDKKWLIIFPVLAAAFDFLPMLNMIPLVPTIMHLLAMIVGVIGSKSAVYQNTANI